MAFPFPLRLVHGADVVEIDSFSVAKVLEDIGHVPRELLLIAGL
jgi:hypothetical protein